MARKTLLAGGKDFPDEPRRAPLLERARQVGHLPGDDRHHVGLEVAALVEEGADRPDVGVGVEMALTRLLKAGAEVISRNFVSNFVPRRLGSLIFVSNFVTPSPRTLACRVIGILAPPASLARWGVLQFPTRFDRRSDHFLCGTGTSERFDNLGL
jgi:hypothetical protein